MENNNAAANSNVNTEVNNNPAGGNAGTEKTFTQPANKKSRLK